MQSKTRKKIYDRKEKKTGSKTKLFQKTERIKVWKDNKKKVRKKERKKERRKERKKEQHKRKKERKKEMVRHIRMSAIMSGH